MLYYAKGVQMANVSGDARIVSFENKEEKTKHVHIGFFCCCNVHIFFFFCYTVIFLNPRITYTFSHFFFFFFLNIQCNTFSLIVPFDLILVIRCSLSSILFVLFFVCLSFRVSWLLTNSKVGQTRNLRCKFLHTFLWDHHRCLR